MVRTFPKRLWYKTNISVVTLQVELLGKIRDIPAVVYDNCSVDILVGRNCPEFQSVSKEAEDLHQIHAVTTWQQSSLGSREEHDPHLYRDAWSRL